MMFFDVNTLRLHTSSVIFPLVGSFSAANSKVVFSQYLFELSNSEFTFSDDHMSGYLKNHLATYEGFEFSLVTSFFQKRTHIFTIS